MKRVLTAVALALAMASPARAAELFFGASAPEIALGESFVVGVFLGASGEEVNAVEGAVTFDGDALRLEAIRDGETVIPLWVERPASSGCPDECRVRFSGVIPGGISHPRAPLFSLAFTALAPGKTSVGATGFRALLDDGLGTATDAGVSAIAFSVRSDRLAMPLEEAPDATPPEPFSVTVVRSPLLFGGRVGAAFSAVDKGTGLDHYEVAERAGPQGPLEGLAWQRAESPYLLLDQTLRSSLYVKAVDRAGNARVSVVTAPAIQAETFRLARIWGILASIAVIILVMLLVWRLVWRKSSKNTRPAR